MEGVLLLSEAILENADYVNQHSEVLEHMTKLVSDICQKHGEESPLVKKTIHLLKARYSLSLC